MPVSAGVATFTGCVIPKAGTGYTLTASSSVTPALKAPADLSFTGVTTGTGRTTRSAAVTCSSGAAACTLSPQAPAGKSRFMSAQVTLVDQFQNPVASSSGSAVTVSLSQAGGDALSDTSISILAGASSSATFTERLADGKAQATATLGSAQATASLTS